MYYCICGQPLPPRAKGGHREREYCSDKCRQRACRQRNKGKHDLDRINREMSERIANAVYQNIHRESWQDELERKESLIASLLQDLKYTHNMNEILQIDNDLLREQLADQAEEITRLTLLLDAQSKKRSRIKDG